MQALHETRLDAAYTRLLAAPDARPLAALLEHELQVERPPRHTQGSLFEPVATAALARPECVS